MSRQYDGEEFDDYVDRVTDETIQTEVDDYAEAAAKRNAAGMSAEVLSLQEAFFEGQRAGARGNGASLNPFQDHTPEHNEWDRGRLSAIGAALNSQRKVA